MDQITICERLAAHPLFQGLGPEALADVARYVRLQQYEAGSTMVWQGEASTTVCLIVAGLAAVTRLAGEDRQAHVLAYLMPGASFGEVGILDQQPRSATVQALTAVEVLVLRRDDFLAILQRYATVAIALARLLGQYLVDTDRHHLRETHPGQLILLFDLGVGAGASAFGQALATQLDHGSTPSTALVAYSDVDAHPGNDRSTVVRHRLGYDSVIPGSDTTLPVAVQATLLTEQIARQYENAVVVLPGTLDAINRVWLMHAQHVVLFVPATAAGYERLRQAQRDLARYTASGRTGVSVVMAGLPAESADPPVEIVADFVVPLLELAEPEEADAAPALPEEVEQVIMTLIERINHTHQVAVYVPTTVAVDRTADTTAYVEQTLAFLGTRFGGATSTPARGVWRSDAVGLVGEAVHLVQTYATGEDLHRYLPDVLAYVKALKTELGQEAMALEVDHQLMLL